MYKYVKITNKSGLRIIAYNVPAKKNALNKDGYIEMTRALNEAAKDDSVVVVVVTGTGDFYSSGNDLSGIDFNPDEQSIRLRMLLVKEMVQAYYRFPKLLIAAVNGPSIGIAATTAALCDIIYASETAYFHTPFTNLGLCCEGCSSYTFPRLMGRSKAGEMLFLNHKMTADEALRFNLVTEVVKITDWDTKLWPRIEQFAQLPKESLRATKQLMKRFEIDDLDLACEREMDALAERFVSEEAAEAVIKFITRKSSKM